MMIRTGTIALLGLLAMAPMAHAADTPAFVTATMCDAAAPIAAGEAVFSRKIRAERPVARQAAPARGRARNARPAAPAARPEPQAAEIDSMLRPAVHFCMSPAGFANRVRYT
ncbi:hypothetical protein ACFQX4_09705 [Roseomonas sp. GCM10028921]